MNQNVSQLQSFLKEQAAGLESRRPFVPNAIKLENAIEKLLDVLFPGFRCQLESFGTEAEVCPVQETLEEVQIDLVNQVAFAFAHQKKMVTDCCIEDFKRQSSEVVDEFLNQLPEIHKTLQTDVQAAYEGDPACKDPDEVILCYPGFLAVATYRLSHLFYKMQVPLIPRILSEWAHRKTGIDIHPGAQIGHHFFIDHGTGVVIGETCRIGNFVKIYQGVTLGALSFPKDSEGKIRRDVVRHPKIEDHVILYANSTVLGGKTVIGARAVIGSSAWITESVQPGQVVVMESPRLKVKDQIPPSFVNNYQI